MNLLKSLLAATSVLATVVGCSSVQVNTAKAPNTDLTRYQTYAWASNSSEKGVPAASIQEQQIKSSVDQKLLQKGLTQAGNQQADLLIYSQAYSQAYSKVESDQSSFNKYGWDWGGLAPTPIREGILSVQLVDRKSKKVVWDGYAADAVVSGSNKRSPQQIRDTVNDLFKKYPNG